MSFNRDNKEERKSLDQRPHEEEKEDNNRTVQKNICKS